jgi:toxin CcdB
MAQFDVHRNPGRHRDRIPFVVVVQSSLYDAYRRRVVVPLVSKSSLGKVANSRFNPTFRIKGVSVVLHPLEIVSVARENLGDKVGSLGEEGDQIIAALDELLTRCPSPGGRSEFSRSRRLFDL